MDPLATNYNPQAFMDDGSCYIDGCMVGTAINFNPSATVQDDALCEFDCQTILNGLEACDDFNCLILDGQVCQNGFTNAQDLAEYWAIEITSAYYGTYSSNTPQGGYINPTTGDPIGPISTQAMYDQLLECCSSNNPNIPNTPVITI
tara:strand:- start:233 stop:673 length:441 start_codon:yes stop_codon:yes gene_type:complete